MPSLRSLNAVKIAALLLAGATTTQLDAQTRTCKNQYPCNYCAVYDNNGNDLAGFVHNYTKQLNINGAKVSEASNGDWGYLLVRTVQVPSVSTKWVTEGKLNHTNYIRTTLAMNKGKDGNTATWWARECNTDNGPLVQIKVEEGAEKVEMDQKQYEKVMNGLLNRKWVLVEYLDTFNTRDYDYMLKSHIASKCGTIHQDDFKSFVDFYNGFMGKFSYLDDAVLTKMSFVTFFAGGEGRHYVGYFNVVNSKLSGQVEPLHIEYERDRDTVVKHTFNRLSGKTVYIYGDDSFGLDKKLIQYAKANDLKLRRRKTNVSTRFNDER